VDRVADRDGTRALAEAYLKFLWTAEAQDIAARHYFRPRDPEVAKRHADLFPAVATFDIGLFGGWQSAQATQFADGGVFDRIIARR